MSESPDCTVVPDQPVLRFPRSGSVRVPFRSGLNHVLVEVVDASGGTHTFFLDTGASFSVITPYFLETAEASEVEGEEIDAAHGVGGELAATPTMHELRGLRVGDLRIEKAGAVQLDLGLDEELGFPIEGILGFNVLSNLVTVIDYRI